jgi:hypothetical protein
MISPEREGISTEADERQGMSEMIPEEESDALSLQVSGAMARQYAEDARGFLRHLADFLVGALGESAVKVQRTGLFGGDNRPVKRIEVEFTGEDNGKASRFTVEDTGGRGSLTATRVQVVRNIALKTDTLPVEDWIEAVSASIAAEAERNKSARNALRDLL